MALGTMAAAPDREFLVGAAVAPITPPLPFWLSGYAARTNMALSVRSPLHAKALAIEDRAGQRVVIVTTDLIGLPREVSDAAAERIMREHGLSRSQILFNSSHTHCGPAVWPNLQVLFAMNNADMEQTRQYASTLARTLASVASNALAARAPARLACGNGRATFAINRRPPRAVGAQAPAAPTDHDVPVISITDPNGLIRAILFGYACHNTTLGADFAEVDGDYAGQAQRELENAFPGCTALFLMLCGGDQNPSPRGQYAHVENHGRALAAAVRAALGGPRREIHGPLRTAWREIPLAFAPHQRADFEAELGSTHVFRQRRARLMLADYDAGRPRRELRYPIQGIALGTGLTLLGLGGEVVVDYALRARREFPDHPLLVAGYCNDVACYIPSLRVLREGGYEPVDSMIYYGLPGPFAEDVEDRVFRGLTAVIEDLHRRR